MRLINLESTPSKDTTLVDPSTVAMIGAVSDTCTLSSPPTAVPEKKAKKEKTSKTENLLRASRPLIVDLRNLIRSGRIILTGLKPSSWPIHSNRPFRLL